MNIHMETCATERMTIRAIQPQDNEPLTCLIRLVLEEHGCVGPGYASSDPELADLYSAYQVPAGQASDRGYWVVVDNTDQRILGGAGFSPLKGMAADALVCELQKMYFHPDLRGKGFGRKLLEHCVQEARQAGYREMYLETVPQMKNARALYQKLGFTPLSARRGNTGHYQCQIFMSRPLDSTTPAHSTSMLATQTLTP